MNLAWGAGAISSSPLAMLTVRTAHVPLLLYVVGAICVLLSLALLRMHFGRPPHEEASPPQGATGKAAGLGVAIMLGILFFVYVGTENGISYWAADHAQRAATWSSNTFTLAPMYFFAGLLSGRGAAPAVLLRLKEVHVTVAGNLLPARARLD